METYLALIDEFYEASALDLDGVAASVIQLKHEMKEVGLSQVGRRLLRELNATNLAAGMEIHSHIRELTSRQGSPLSG